MTQSNKSVATAYDFKASKEYDQRRFHKAKGRLFHALEWEQIELVINKLTKGARVLEVGFGSGRFIRLLGEKGFLVWGVEPSHTMLEISSDKCRNLKNVTLALGEGAKLDFPDSSFDFVYSIRVTNQTESKDYAFIMINEMIRVAKPDGYVLIEFVNNERPFKKKTKTVRLSFAEIEQLAMYSNAYVVRQGGVLVYSQSILNKMPGYLVPIWGSIERLSAKFLWRWASRGYVVLRKEPARKE